MAWEAEFTDEFEEWWNGLSETEQIKIDAAVRVLEEYGPDLPFPMSSGVTGSRHSHMRELRVQVRGKPCPGSVRVQPETRRDPPGRRRQDRGQTLV